MALKDFCQITTIPGVHRTYYSIDFNHPSLGMSLKTFESYKSARNYLKRLNDKKIRALIKR